MSSAKTVKEVLLATKYILNLGWTQGASYRNSSEQSVYRTITNNNGYQDLNPEIASACLSGAIELVEVDSSFHKTEALQMIYRLLPSGESITSFNDKPGRTKEQVIRLLDRAISAEESK